MKQYPKHIQLQLSGAQASDLLSAINKMVLLLPENDRAVKCIINIHCRALVLKIITKQLEQAPQKIKLLTEHAATLHYLHCNFHPSQFGLNVHERNVMQLAINVIDQKLS